MSLDHPPASASEEPRLQAYRTRPSICSSNKRQGHLCGLLVNNSQQPAQHLGQNSAQKCLLEELDKVPPRQGCVTIKRRQDEEPDWQHPPQPSFLLSGRNQCLYTPLTTSSESLRDHSTGEPALQPNPGGWSLKVSNSTQVGETCGYGHKRTWWEEF